MRRSICGEAVDLWTPTVDGTEVRNIIVVTSVDGRTLVMALNVPRESEGEWGAIGERIVSSIRVVE